MSKHTPGPWRWDGEPGRSDLRHEGDPGAVDGCVLRHEDCEGMWFARYHKEDENEANARLIAAAPDLLEALIAMEAEKSDYMRRNNLGNPASEDTNKMARAAIAKATGGEP